VKTLTRKQAESLRQFYVLRLTRALQAFARGEIGERELIAIEMAVNESLAGLPYTDQEFHARTADALLERAQELSV